MKRTLAAAAFAGALLVPTLGAVDASAGALPVARGNDLCLYETSSGKVCLDLDKLAAFLDTVINGRSGFAFTL